MKKLYRSEENKIFFGIVGGISEFAQVDATILRLIWLIVVIFTGIFPGVIAYLLALLIVPRRADFIEGGQTKPVHVEEIAHAGKMENSQNSGCFLEFLTEKN